MQNENGNQALMSFVWGAAIGAGIALLVAPRSGEETRRQLSDAAVRLRDSAKDKVGDAKNMIRDGARDVGDAIATGREAFASAKEAGRETFASAKDNAMSRSKV